MKLTRNYNSSDAVMAESARTVHQLLLEDLTAFSNFSTKYTPAYADAFLAKIEAADEVVTDQALLGQQVVKTEHVLNAMEEARLIYRRAKAYAEQAFLSSEPIIIQEFTRGYADARMNQPKMLVFLETLLNTLQRHEAILLDPNKGGMPNSFIENVIAVRNKLLQKNVIQEVFIKTRVTLTEDRIKTLNACYDNMIEINNFAQIVFNDSPARRSVYVFNPSSEDVDIQIFTGSIAPNEYKTIHTLTYQADTFISFENKGVVPLLFDIAPENAPNDASALAGNVVDLGGGAVVTHSMNWLNQDLTDGSLIKIVVFNESLTATGLYEVVVNVG